jgi:peptidoglycan/xylan/chitin deacetylase (PgdA/CDA1 family)
MKLIIILALLLLVGLAQASYAQSCQCVAFRLDDIQDYWLDTVQTKVIDTFQEKNASLTVGIIGNYFENDTMIVDKIQQSLQKQSPKIEVANHGFNHEDFTQFPEGLQYILMERTNQKITRLLGVTPSVFIAPYNTINSDTMQAFGENHFQTISANETEDPPPYLIKGEAIHHLPETAYTGNLNKDNTLWIGYNHKETFASIMSSLQKYGFAVIVIHPQEYSNRDKLHYTNTVNETQVQELKQLIDELQKNDIKIVTMSEIPNYVGPQTIPAWIRNVFSWYQKGMISENDVSDMVQYLLDQKITQFDSSSFAYPVHHDITTTVFWVGEPADKDNQFINNSASIWDDKWVANFGGVDDPNSRNGYYPSKFIPHENPFYFALPYNDITNGTRMPDAYRVYWSHDKIWDSSESMVKNKWIKITKGDKSAYAQWEDAGPFVYDDVNYVFGTANPQNKQNNNAGLDVSPGVSDFINLYGDNNNVTTWQFVDFNDVPDGPWKKIITTSQITQLGG